MCHIVRLTGTGLGGLLHLVEFQDIPDGEIVEVLDADTALVAGGYVLDIVLEPLEAADGGIRQRLLAALYADLDVAGDLAVRDIAAGGLGLAGGKDGPDLGVALDDLSKVGSSIPLRAFSTSSVRL
jgi:hypothetical protein